MLAPPLMLLLLHAVQNARMLIEATLSQARTQAEQDRRWRNMSHCVDENNGRLKTYGEEGRPVHQATAAACVHATLVVSRGR